ncbi:MAG: CMD domain protein [Thermomicrobia bacterium]|nr:CMD domain protein [Thermomicrobia bacterium]
MAQSTEPTTAPTGDDAPDVINRLAGIAADSPLGRLRAERPEVVRAAQGSYQALLEPNDPGGVSRSEREMIALRVAVLMPSPSVAAWHRARLRDLGADDEYLAAIEQFPDGPALSARAATILRHTDRLAREPDTATPPHIAALKAVGLGPRDIVTISQLIAYLSFEVRALVGLRLLEEEL